MSIENSFCRCDWDKTVQLWNSAKSEDDFANSFFTLEGTEEIQFSDEVHYHLASWELLEDFADWYRGQEFPDSKDWGHFCSATKQLGLMETEIYNFGPVNELIDENQAEFVFGAMSPDSVQNILTHLKQISPEGIDKFIRDQGLAITVPFSEIVSALIEKLDSKKGLIIFAG